MTRALTAVLRTATLLLLAALPAFAQQKTTTRNPHGRSLKEPCASCHAATAWKPTKLSGAFKHAPDKFPLVGAHEQTKCMACHTALDFKGASSKCLACHKDVHNGELGSECSRCHTTRTFVDRAQMQQIHQVTRFPLTGAHVVVDCLVCHPPAAQGHMVFVNRPTECAACHLPAYNATGTATVASHQTQGFPTTCADCHNTTSWNPSGMSGNFDHSKTLFPLTGSHLVPPRACSDCHNGGVYAGLATTCITCHTTEYNNTTTPAHLAAGFPKTCENCHSTTTWAGAPFDHNVAPFTFALSGNHTVPPRACGDCHGSGVFKGLATTCISCHKDKFDGTTSTVIAGVPPHAAAGFATTCTDCHGTSYVAWTGGTYNHNVAPNTFPLTGMHVTTTCAQCHTGSVYKGMSVLCFSCHKADYDFTAVTGHYADNPPAHSTAGFPTTCENCHTTTTWVTGAFNHNAPPFTFSLSGNHTVPPRSCTDCHTGTVYKGLATTCISCHLKDWNNTTTAPAGSGIPPHSANGFSNTCTTCHGTSYLTWTGGTYNHNVAPNTFPLTGVHITTTCVQCHTGTVYKGMSVLCYSCHKPDYDFTSVTGHYTDNPPPHAATGYPTTCESCHTTTTWVTGAFNHNVAPFTFSLFGNHRVPPATCAQCHTGGVYKGLSVACYSCHLKEWNSTTSPVVAGIPPHTAAGFATTCSDCHGTAFLTFAGGTYNHNVAPNTFPLTGTHVTTTCAQCHTGSVYKGMSVLCYSCHKADYDFTSVAGHYADNPPPHAAGGFPTTCESCHATTLWSAATFNHNIAPFTFPLSGNHRVPPATCAQCHSSGVYKGLSTLCYSCHLKEWTSTNSAAAGSGIPPHAANGFATTCADCHGTAFLTFTGGTYNHNVAPNTFPLTGRHVTATCGQCHTTTVFKGLSVLCYSCHKAAYDSTTTPGFTGAPAHATTGYATTCESCHTTTTWLGAAVNHNAAPFTFFLTGMHTVPPRSCADCHSSGVYKGLSVQCYSCHKTTYDTTSNPPHATAGLGTVCSGCHTSTTSWAGATMTKTNHPWFSPTHQGSSCLQCHDTGIYSTFNCLTCHKKTATDQKHQGKSGYQYVSTVCIGCHKG